MENTVTYKLLPENDSTECNPRNVSTIRRLIPQALACSVAELVRWNSGFATSFATLLIAALLNNTTNELSLTPEEASWFVSIPFVALPVGNIISAFIVDTLGRKWTLTILTVPFLLGWLLIIFSKSVEMLYLASIIFGLCSGISSAPCSAYIGEVVETGHRDLLTSYVQLCGAFAYFVVYFFGTITDWRTTASLCAFLPITTAFLLILIPDSPLWLISGGNYEGAEKSLRWLRGWTSREDIEPEMHDLIKYHRKTTVWSAGSDQISVSEMTPKQKFYYFLRPEIRQPILLITVCHGIHFASGLHTIRPYLGHVFEALQMEVDTNWAIMFTSFVNILGYAACMLTVSYLGKRTLTTLSLIGAAFCTLIFSGIAQNYVSPEWSFPIMVLYSFATSLGISPIPQMLQSELYPFQGKCTAVGITCTATCLIGFIATKSYLSLENSLSVEGIFLLYAVLNIFGMVYLYVYLPETGGRSFEEIEMIFGKKM